jgi:F0F1-type ATP synthase membrane subunit b/b'
MAYKGGIMEEERTLLQQIRDKEQEYSKKVDAIKKETDAQITAAKAQRDSTLLDAERKGKNIAEELVRMEKQKTDTEIGQMKKAATAETENARSKGERNLPSAVKKIESYVIME